jgi:hypothetical protein
MNIKIHSPRASTHLPAIPSTRHRTARPTLVFESSTKPQSIATEALGSYIKNQSQSFLLTSLLTTTRSTYRIRCQK